ncbi:SDR family oxidoreductase [Halobacillus litoralis]|uniref:SDR family oxidoreductase n=1 Tax=Halobacillus litoralis TaxID=45668 RepID=UPI001CD6E5A7|nr:SDR family oxidoreductase [Halobacillus litoralis]MCA0970226.1 SDR family oxidoreductase [Halobacillus litoralis]
MSSENRKIAVVTGASREDGIGTAVCHALAEDGMDIFFTHFGKYDEIEGNGQEHEWPSQLKEQLSAKGVRAAHMEIDFSISGSHQTLLDAVEKEWGTPSVLIHNATYQTDTDFRSLNAETLDTYYKINNREPILLSTEFAKRFEEMGGSDEGRIIQLVSGGPDPNNLAYIGTKGMLKAMTYPLAVGLAPLGITVNSVDPGPTDTGWMDESLKEQLKPLFPKGRIGKAEDAAKLIRFLAGPESGWITGQTIDSNGGFLGK